MADVIYNSSKRGIWNGSIDLDCNAIKLMLVTASYTPDQDAYTKRLVITSEIAGTDYAAGGTLLGKKDARQDLRIEGVAVDAPDFRTSHHV